MKIFALETDIETLNKSFLSPSEEEILHVRFHWIRFLFALIKAVVFTAILAAAAAGAAVVGAPGGIITGIATVVWALFIGWPLFRSWIDWQFDELVVTTEKIIIVDQSSIIRQAIHQMNLDNIASVQAVTQYWGLMPFGKLKFDLKEGTGQRQSLSYIPQAQRVCSVISDTIVKFHRRGATPIL